MSFRPFYLATLLLFVSCAYAQEGQIQDVTLETPGAENAVCYVYVDKVKHKVLPPQKLTVTKSEEIMEVDCLAPGNRRKKIFIEPAYSKKIYPDAVIPPLLAWDFASRSIYQYPDTVTVDFTYTPVKPEPLPAQNRPDVKQPEEYMLEEKIPGRLRMNSDIDAPPVVLQRRITQGEKKSSAEPYMVDTSGSAIDKGSLQKAVNPSGAASSPASSSGVAYPGQ